MVNVERLRDASYAVGVSALAPVFTTELEAARPGGSAREDHLWSLLDVFPRAVILVGRDLAVTGMNAAANAMLTHCSSVFVDASSHLRIRNAQAHAELAAAVAEARTSAGGEVAVMTLACPSSGVAQVDIAAMRLGDSTVAVIMSDRQAETVTCPEALRKLYGFTATEQRVVSALVAGQSPTGVAARLGISLNTIRRHLKQIFLKCGVTRQADLIRLITCGPAILRCDRLNERRARR